MSRYAPRPQFSNRRPYGRPLPARNFRNGVGDVLFSLGGALLAVAVIALIGFGVSYAWRVSPTTAQSKVEDSGFSNVLIGDRHVFTAEMRCGKNYVAYFDFTGTNANGRVVSGRICKGDPPFMGWRVNY